LILRPEPKQDSKTKADKTFRQPVFCQTVLLNAFRVFAFFGTKNPFGKLCRAKMQITANGKVLPKCRE